ncbi:TMEM241 [Bugula neritina]|uniref:TMEM241 n=1 Tax=Bugula neritina TaxID=10212 RepID=A0A7J7KHH2_BUGNE|nr:TMEM241 [Bugula neritina]
MSPLMIGILFTLSSISSLFVNKYVLSVLKFTFPTIFQGWQCLVSLLVLVCILRRQTIIIKIKRCFNLHYLSEVIFFVCSIYAGSKALSKLPVPVFLGLQNLSLVAVTILKLFLLEEKPRNQTILSQMVLLTACAFIWYNEQSVLSPISYFWVVIHLVSSGFCAVFEYVNEEDTLDHEGIVIVNNLFGFLSLAPCTFFFGDLQAVQTYPHLYFSKFYVGVIFSGVFSAFTSALYLKLINNDLKSVTSESNITGYTALSRMLAAVVSPVLFDRTSVVTLIWCVVACLAVPAIQIGESKEAVSADSRNNHLV